jgi:lysosomal acid lipase/cholesteryl ester hydrolase
VIRTGQIAKYDYVDQAQNVLHYGQVVPPTYDLTKIPSEFPLFLGVGGKDILADVQDVKLLRNDLNNHDPNKLVVLSIDDYAHVDFCVADNAKQVIYDPMIAFFNAY